MTKLFYCVRHGETIANVNNTFQGTLDLPLTATGKEQGRVLGAQLKDLPVHRIVSSPQRRAVETAEIALRESGRSDLPLIIEPEVRERNYANLQGLDKEDIKAAHGPLTPEVLKEFGAETDAELDRRIVPAVERLLQEPGTMLLVGHSGTMKALFRGLLGHKKVSRPKNGLVYRFIQDDSGNWNAYMGDEKYTEPV